MWIFPYAIKTEVIEKKTLEADKKPSASALQLTLGKYLERTSYYSRVPYHSTFLQTEVIDVQRNWLFGHDF